MKKSLLIKFFVLAVAALFLNSCNTLAGFGRDLQSAGGAIHDSAQQP